MCRQCVAARTSCGIGDEEGAARQDDGEPAERQERTGRSLLVRARRSRASASSRRGFPRRGRGFGLDTHRRVKRAVVGILHRVQELEAREEPLEPLLRDPESLHQTLGREDVKRDVTQAHAAALGDGEHVVLPRLGSDEVYARGRHRHLRTRAMGAFTRRFPRARRGDLHNVASVADAGWATRGSALSQPSPATPPGSRASRSSASLEYQSTRVERVTSRRARVTVRPEATHVRRIAVTGAAKRHSPAE